MQGQNEMSSEIQTRKCRMHVKSPETGRNFIVERGEKVTDAPWSLSEKLLCGECAHLRIIAQIQIIANVRLDFLGSEMTLI